MSNVSIVSFASNLSEECFYVSLCEACLMLAARIRGKVTKRLLSREESLNFISEESLYFICLYVHGYI